MQDNIKVAVIGAGAMAREHIRAFQAVSGTSVVGITSRTTSRAEALAKEYSIATVAETQSQLLAKGPIDLMVVAVPEYASRAVISEVIDAGIPVLAEKPIGLHLADCLDVVNKAEAAKVPLWVGLNRRCYSSSLAALKGLEDDPNPRFIDVHDQQSRADAIAIGYCSDIVENWMYANSIHLVDYVAAFGRGDIANVLVTDHWQRDAASCVVSAHVSFSSGDIAHYTAVWGQPGPWSCSVTTAKNRWEMRPLEVAKVQKAGTRVLEDVPIDQVDKDFKAVFHFQAQDVVSAVRNGQAANYVPDGAEALRVTRLLAQIYEIETR